VKLESDGLPAQASFVYVDESTCIGCTWCADVARNTFYVEPEGGKGRVHTQGNDNASTIDEAIATCPIDCIHHVPWEELVALENKRDMAMQSTTPGRIIDEKYRTRSLAESRAPVKQFLVPAREQAARIEAAHIRAENEQRARDAEVGCATVSDELMTEVVFDPCESTLDCPIDAIDTVPMPHFPELIFDASLFGEPVILDECEEAESEECTLLKDAAEIVEESCEIDDFDYCGPAFPDVCDVDMPPAVCQDPDGVGSRIASIFNIQVA
jgi:ferredoxin